MLIDLLLEDDHGHLLSAAERTALNAAARFVMQEDFAVAADQLSKDADSVAKALPFCRLPYPVCWLEFAHADRERHVMQAYDVIREVHPLRIGWLLRQTGADGSWSAAMYWSFDAATEQSAGIGLLRAHGRIHVSGAAAVLCCDASKLNNEDLIAVFELQRGHIAAMADEWCKGLFGQEPPFAPGYFSDWQGEPKYLAATLALMNSKNAAEKFAVIIPAKLNKRRQRDGKLPFLDYHLLRIPGRYKQKHIASGEVGGQQLRAHFVRGHYKVRRTGVYFWNSFQRGNPLLGFVRKDYTLRPPAPPEPKP